MEKTEFKGKKNILEFENDLRELNDIELKDREIKIRKK